MYKQQGEREREHPTKKQEIDFLDPLLFPFPEPVGAAIGA